MTSLCRTPKRTLASKSLECGQAKILLRVVIPGFGQVRLQKQGIPFSGRVVVITHHGVVGSHVMGHGPDLESRRCWLRAELAAELSNERHAPFAGQGGISLSIQV